MLDVIKFTDLNSGDYAVLELLCEIKKHVIDSVVYFIVKTEELDKVDIVFPSKTNKICYVCGITGNYGYIRGIGNYCANHKLEGMKDTISGLCKDCNKYPSFNVKGL